MKNLLILERIIFNCQGPKISFTELSHVLFYYSYLVVIMRGSRKFCQRGSNFDNVFFDEGRKDPSTTIRGSSSARQRNAIKLRFAGVPMMAHQ